MMRTKKEFIKDQNDDREKNKFGPALNHRSIMYQLSKRARVLLESYDADPRRKIKHTKRELAAELRHRYNALPDGKKEEFNNRFIYSKPREEVFFPWADGQEAKEIAKNGTRNLDAFNALRKELLRSSEIRSFLLGPEHALWFITA